MLGEEESFPLLSVTRLSLTRPSERLECENISERARFENLDDPFLAGAFDRFYLLARKSPSSTSATP